MTTDYFPTILEMTSMEVVEAGIDGRSLVPLLKNVNATLDRNLYWHYPHYHAGGDGPYSAVRSGKYRLIEFHEDRSVRLYDLENDIGEQTDLATVMSERAADLQGDLHRWRDSIQAQMPTLNASHDPQRETQVRKRTK